DPLRWWWGRNSKNSGLDKVTHCILTLPASQTELECIFSTGGNIMTFKRNIIDPENVLLVVFI
ncbi:unnamed protein product, partial [Choristocarpus tenellus]